MNLFVTILSLTFLAIVCWYVYPLIVPPKKRVAEVIPFPTKEKKE